MFVWFYFENNQKKKKTILHFCVYFVNLALNNLQRKFEKMLAAEYHDLYNKKILLWLAFGTNMTNNQQIINFQLESLLTCFKEPVIYIYLNNNSN